MVEICKTLDSSKWDSALSRFNIKDADIYFSSFYYSVYEKYGDGVAHCFVFIKGNRMAIYPFLKNCVNDFGYDLRNRYFDIQGAYGFNGVLTNSFDNGFCDEFYDSFNSYCSNSNIIAEFTRFHPLIGNEKFSERHLNVQYNRKTVVLDLSKSKDDIWLNSYSSVNRNMIRKAKKSNIEIFQSDDINDYYLFYSIYAETMKNVNSEEYLCFNIDYFINLKTLLQDNQKLILAKCNNRIVGGIILMLYKSNAHYHLSARVSEYEKFAINNLLLDYAIDIAKQNNCERMHFGGGRSSEDRDSLLKFKSNFSKDFASFYTGKKIHNIEVYQEVMKQWEDKYPQSYKKNKALLLGYREK